MAKVHANAFKFFLLSLVSIELMCCGTAKEKEVKGVSETPGIEMKDSVGKRRIAAGHFRKGQAYFRKKELIKAEDEVKTALSLDPRHPVPHLLLGDIYCVKKDFQNALDEYRHAKALDETKGLPHVKIGRVYIELGMNEKAIEAFRTAIELDPDIPGLHKELGNLYRQMGLKEKAINEYRKAEAVSKSGGEYAANKAFKISDKQERRGFDYLDSRVENVLKLGDEFLKDGSLDLAIEEFRIAVKLEPDSAITNQKLGDAYVKKGMLDEAITQYERVKELKPESSLSYLGLGIVHARMFDIDRAISYFERGISIDPAFPLLHFELAMAYMKADMLDEAIYELEKTVELDTINPQPKEILDKVKKEKEAEEGFVTIQNGPFILKYDPKQNRSFIDYTLQSLQKAYQKLVSDMSYQPKKNIIVKLYPNLRQFHLAASTPEWFVGGVASAKDSKILLATPKKEININKFPEVITHELTHVFTNLITFSNHPAWIHEGIALWEADQWDSRKEVVLKWAISEEELFSLEELKKPFTRLKDHRRINLAYAQSYTAVKFILDKYGREKLLEILDEFSKGNSVDKAARHVLNMAMEEFEQQWFDFIRETLG